MDVSHSVLTIWIFRSPHEDDGHDKEKEEGNDNDEFSCHPFIFNFHTHQHTAGKKTKKFVSLIHKLQKTEFEYRYHHIPTRPGGQKNNAIQAFRQGQIWKNIRTRKRWKSIVVPTHEKVRCITESIMAGKNLSHRRITWSQSWWKASPRKIPIITKLMTS